MKKIIMGILNSPVKWREQEGESGLNYFHFNHSVIQISTLSCWTAEALMKHDESPGCLKPIYVPGPPNGLCLGKVDVVRLGPKEIDFQQEPS